LIVYWLTPSEAGQREGISLILGKPALQKEPDFWAVSSWGAIPCRYQD